MWKHVIVLQARSSRNADLFDVSSGATMLTFLPAQITCKPARFKAASVPTGYNLLVQLLSDKVELKGFAASLIKDKKKEAGRY